MGINAHAGERTFVLRSKRSWAPAFGVVEPLPRVGAEAGVRHGVGRNGRVALASAPFRLLYISEPCARSWWRLPLQRDARRGSERGCRGPCGSCGCYASGQWRHPPGPWPAAAKGTRDRLVCEGRGRDATSRFHFRRGRRDNRWQGIGTRACRSLWASVVAARNPGVCQASRPGRNAARRGEMRRNGVSPNLY